MELATVVNALAVVARLRSLTFSGNLAPRISADPLKLITDVFNLTFHTAREIGSARMKYSAGAPWLARGPAFARCCYGLQCPMDIFIRRGQTPHTFLESKTSKKKKKKKKIDKLSPVTFFQSLFFKSVYCIVFFKIFFMTVVR